MKQRSNEYQNHIALEFCNNVTQSEFFEDVKEQFALCMALAQIGEFVGKLPDAFKEDYPDIPWKRIKGLRNIISHDYDNLDLDQVWNAATVHLPVFMDQIDQMLQDTR